MRLPVQVWTPFFWKSSFQDDHVRDLERAKREWRGEHRVYLDTNAKEVIRWTRIDQGRQVSECVIPSETVNCFVISHVDGQGRVYPYLPLPEEWHGSVSGSYAHWLEEPANIYLVDSEYTRMPMPVIKDGQGEIVDAMIKIRPGANVPIADLTDGGVFTVKYKGAGQAKMLAPNQEVEAVVGKSRYERHVINGKERLVTVSEKGTNSWGLSSQIAWSKKPFNYMFGEGAGVDLAMHQTIFKRCIRELQEGWNGKVMKEAETWLGALTSPGRSFIWHSWFCPMAMANVDEALCAIETKYNLQARTMEELEQSEEFHRVMNLSVEVVVANDWLGYMWWDFYQDLREKKTVRCCEACGRIIRGGHKDRRYCNRSENPECVRKRNAISQRKKRSSYS